MFSDYDDQQRNSIPNRRAMSFPIDDQTHTGKKPESANNSNIKIEPHTTINPVPYQQPNHQMRNEYLHPLNSSEYGSQRQMNLGEEVSSYQQRKSNQNAHQPYYRHEDTRYPSQVDHQVVERRSDIQPVEDVRQSKEAVQYAFPSRDGPSPGRGYNYGTLPDDPLLRQQTIPENTSTNGLPFRNPAQTPMKGKRKNDGTTPDGPRLISNQSSDDSINALLPINAKRARVGSLFPTESASFMKSFTLSPMNSRTFSRDEPIVDIPRFGSNRGSSEGNRIFHSWSSGNSRSENHSPSDVQICYNDWHSLAAVGRPNNSSNRHLESKLSHPEETKSHPTQIPGRYEQRSQPPPPHWQQVDPTRSREQHAPHHPHEQASFDMQNRGYHSNSRQLQALHAEDRYNEQLFQGYSQNMDTNRPYWNNQGPPATPVYSSQRRDDVEERHGMNQTRGGLMPLHPRHNGPRHSGPAPPMANSWGRYGPEYHPGLYDSHQNGSRQHSHPSYDSWGHGGIQGRQHFDGQYDLRRTGEMPSYVDSLHHLKNLTIENGPDGSSTGMRTTEGNLLLALPEDRISLSETLCIVRENVEVFIASESDVKAPAPGRKRPVVVGQVGLRCIHCRAATHQSEKVKRAVCFPSSIKRIYRTVIDMKLDHFKACRFVPIELKMKLEELRATNARSTGTTMQYFVQAAKRMGMVDSSHGIRTVKPEVAATPIKEEKEPLKEPSVKSPELTQQPSNAASIMRRPPTKPAAQQQNVQSGVSFSLSLDLSISGESNVDGSKTKAIQSVPGGEKPEGKGEYFSGKAVLAVPEDKSALSSLRCFLRENVCAFSATNEDIAVRTPTTFSVVKGQVGIGCIHCLALPARERSNRAVCFPFSIGRIYQSVADIQRFHLGECKMVPPEVRKQFVALQNASSKGSKGLATRQYWVTSAKKLGLADTDTGIRFIRDPSIPLEKAKSLDILAQVASDVTTAAKPLVLPEDKPYIAGFLYVVMKQLQPCRFTEADRNKRRLKDVGCIGVECRHCAGKVDGRKFFWSSVNAVESNFVSVHTHMMECKYVSHELKEKLAKLKVLRKEQTARLKSGSQKSFFARVWNRLHAEGNKIPSGTSNPKKLGEQGEGSLKSLESLDSQDKKGGSSVNSKSIEPLSPSQSMPSPFDYCTPVNDSAVTSPASSSAINAKVKAECSSPTCFPSPMMPSKSDYEKDGSGNASMESSSFPTSPIMSPYELTNNVTPMNMSDALEQENRKGENDFNASIIEQI